MWNNYDSWFCRFLKNICSWNFKCDSWITDHKSIIQTLNHNNSSYFLWTNKVIIFAWSISYLYDLRWKSLSIALILLGDRSLSSISYNCFWILFHEWQHLQLLNTSHVFLSYKKVLWDYIHCVEIEVSYLCWSDEKLNYVLKIDSDKLFKDLLTNKIFSEQVLSWNLKMEFCLSRGLVWKFLGW